MQHFNICGLHGRCTQLQTASAHRVDLRFAIACDSGLRGEHAIWAVGAAIN